MTEKLRSHLGKTRGFTLVELLIVIAIIAILVLLVIVALDPLERLRDTQDRNAQNEVRQGASAVAACITKETAAGGTPFTAAGPCDDAAGLAGGGYISNAASLGNLDQWALVATAGAENICLGHANANGHERVIWNFNTGVVTDAEAVGNTC